jgi:hypothetical protein
VKLKRVLQSYCIARTHTHTHARARARVMCVALLVRTGGWTRDCERQLLENFV